MARIGCGPSHRTRSSCSEWKCISDTGPHPPPATSSGAVHHEQAAERSATDPSERRRQGCAPRGVRLPHPHLIASQRLSGNEMRESSATWSSLSQG